MGKLREQLDTDSRQAEHAVPTRYKTSANKYAVHCSSCGELYYVDEHTHRRVKSALEGDPSENPFCCKRCEEEYSEEEHRR